LGISEVFFKETNGEVSPKFCHEMNLGTVYISNFASVFEAKLPYGCRTILLCN
jgi:hypothetical protein